MVTTVDCFVMLLRSWAAMMDCRVPRDTATEQEDLKSFTNLWNLIKETASQIVDDVTQCVILSEKGIGTWVDTNLKAFCFEIGDFIMAIPWRQLSTESMAAPAECFIMSKEEFPCIRNK